MTEAVNRKKIGLQETGSVQLGRQWHGTRQFHQPMGGPVAEQALNLRRPSDAPSSVRSES